ncbi:MAG TPA: hypothetical protein VJL34_12550 [Anaerolineales bacterium]|nr:hypothetical protein [Anaerolineales bacterium]
MTYPEYLVARIKRADLLASIGAGVLGAGIALLLANILASYAIPILLLGLIAHAGGMFQKHRLEQHGEGVRVWWAEALYWLCWLGLAALLLFIVFRLI